MNIAVTGNVGSGKSRITSMLSGMLGYEAVDADSVCRQLLMPDCQGWREVRTKWGDKFFKPDGRLDRVHLRESVFAEPRIREGLEEILHPLVQNHIVRLMEKKRKAGDSLIAEIPLLYEVGWHNEFDHIVAVYAPVEICLLRTARRDGVSGLQVATIFSLQMPPEQKADLADYVIDNSGIWSSTVTQTAVLVRNLRKVTMV